MLENTPLVFGAATDVKYYLQFVVNICLKAKIYDKESNAIDFNISLTEEASSTTQNHIERKVNTMTGGENNAQLYKNIHRLTTLLSPSIKQKMMYQPSEGQYC